MCDVRLDWLLEILRPFGQTQLSGKFECRFCRSLFALRLTLSDIILLKAKLLVELESALPSWFLRHVQVQRSSYTVSTKGTLRNWVMS